MTNVLEVGAPTGPPVGKGADREHRMVLKFTKSAEYLTEPAYLAAAEFLTAVAATHMTREAIWSGSAYRPTDSLNILLPRCSIALITTFAPDPYEVKRPLAISIYSSEGEYSASFFDGNIHTTGDNEQEAFENLKSLILDMFDSLTSRRVEDLGPGPLHQRSVLQQFISKIS